MRPWIVVVAALSLHLTAAAEPAADPEREAIRAYQAKDYPGFLAHQREAYAKDPSSPRQIYNLAAAEALAGSPAAAVRLLRQLADAGLGFELEKEDDFRALAKRPDFRAVAGAMQRNRAPRGKAEPAFTLREPELLTEGVAYDPDSKTFFVTSVRHRKIVAITGPGGATQRDFTPEAQGGTAGVFGVAVDRARRLVWASTAAFPVMLGYRPEDKDRSSLAVYELATGKPIASYPVPADGKPHALGDVIVGPGGDAYATDSLTSRVYRVTGGAAGGKLEVFFEGPFRSLQGLAITPDGKTLYLADYALGVFALDLASKALTRLAPAPGVVVTGIDGLYLHRGRLVATQNGIQPQRVIELTLDPTGAKLTAQRILLSGDPRARDLSLATIVDDALYLNAAAGWDHYDDQGVAKATPRAAPHVILKIPLPR